MSSKAISLQDRIASWFSFGIVPSLTTRERRRGVGWPDDAWPVTGPVSCAQDVRISHFACPPKSISLSTFYSEGPSSTSVHVVHKHCTLH